MSERGARLLIAEDNKVNRLLLTRAVEQLGHTVASAENGRVALDMLRKERYDLVLLDVQMPELDGFAVLEQMVEDDDLRHVPVIVTSALEGMDEVVRCIALGADDFLRKPVNPVLLNARLASSLEKKRLRDQQRQMIERFATHEVARDLQHSGFALGGRYVEGAAMFSDIRDFTTLSEQLGPEETIELLNTYYTLMFEAITSQGGVVNQMVGDGLMAIFGAPLALQDPALAAVRAALDMQEMMREFNAERVVLRRPPVQIGVGIATGRMIAGYTGTTHRATYTCVGDAVNLAARLEAHTKDLGKGVAVCGATYEALQGRIPMERCEPVTFKGKAGPTHVYAT